MHDIPVQYFEPLPGKQTHRHTFSRQSASQSAHRFGQTRFNAFLRLAGINLLIGFAVLRIDNMAHIGGLIAGFALGYLLAPRLYVTEVSPQLVWEDRAGLQHTWWIVVLATLLFGGLTAGAILFWSSSIT